MEASALRGKLCNVEKAATLTGLRPDQIEDMVKEDRGLARALVHVEKGILLFYTPAVKRYVVETGPNGEYHCPIWLHVFRRMGDGNAHTVPEFVEKYGFERNSVYVEMKTLKSWGLVEAVSGKLPKQWRITAHGLAVWQKLGSSANRADMIREAEKARNSGVAGIAEYTQPVRTQRSIWLRIYELMIDDTERDVMQIVETLGIHKASAYADTRALCDDGILKERWVGVGIHARKKNFSITDKGLRIWKKHDGNVTLALIRSE